MKYVVLCPNKDRDIGFAVTNKAKKILEDMNVPYLVCELSDKLDTILENAEIIITFGGDGTILHAARLASKYQVPLLGINLGNKGFIAELEADDVELIRYAALGKYSIETRMMLDVSVKRSGETVYSGFALNDIVLGGIARVINVTVYGDGNTITSFSGDGLVIATPTGSTAYSMAAGGPIVEPDTENIIVTPICPHVLQAKTYILRADRKVNVKVEKLKGKTAYMSADGGDLFILSNNDIIEVRKSELVTKLIRVTDRNFYEKVSKKLRDRS